MIERVTDNVDKLGVSVLDLVSVVGDLKKQVDENTNNLNTVTEAVEKIMSIISKESDGN